MKPKYRIVYDAIKEKIINGSYHVNEQIPDGETLAKEYKCSVLTVKKALDILVMEGAIVRKRGLGTFVKKVINTSENRRQDNPEVYYSSKRRLIREDYTSIVEKFEVIKCDEEIARNLDVESGSFVYYIIRVRLYKGEARIVEYTWMPLSLIKGLEMKHLEGSIYHYIVKGLKLKIQSAHMSVNATRPNEIEKKYFSMNDNDFVNEVTQTAFLDNSEIFEYSIARHIPKYFEFETTVIKHLY